MTVLVPLDGSPAAESALAIEGQRLLLLRVVDLPEPAAPGVAVSLAQNLILPQRQQAELERARTYLEPLGTQTLVVAGHARDEILRVAREQHVDLIAMTSHGRSGARRWLLGSVAEGVLRQAPCPVLLVRPPAPGPLRFGHVLVPVDGSQESLVALARVRPFLVPEAQITLLRATELEPEDSLQAALEPVEPGSARLHRVVAAGPAAATILEQAEARGCDLIAMTTHGRTGFRRFVLGSVTERVTRAATCPVLVFPPTE